MKMSHQNMYRKIFLSITQFQTKKDQTFKRFFSQYIDKNMSNYASHSSKVHADYDIIESYLNSKKNYEEFVENVDEDYSEDKIKTVQKASFQNFIKCIELMFFYMKHNHPIPQQKLKSFYTPSKTNLSLYRVTDPTIPEDIQEFSFTEYYAEQDKLTHKAAVLLNIEYQTLLFLYVDMTIAGSMPENLEESFRDFIVKSYIIFSLDPVLKDEIITNNFFKYLIMIAPFGFGHRFVLNALLEKGINHLDENTVVIEQLKLHNIAAVISTEIKYFIGKDFTRLERQAYNDNIAFVQERYRTGVGPIKRIDMEPTPTLIQQQKYYKQFKLEIQQEFALDYVVDFIELDQYFVRANKTPSFIKGLNTIYNKHIKQLNLVKDAPDEINMDSNSKKPNK